MTDPVPPVVPPTIPPVVPPPAAERWITLAQFCKKEGFAGSGGQAKALIRTGVISVNGSPESRPGRQLVPGDVVTTGTRRAIVGP